MFCISFYYLYLFLFVGSGLLPGAFGLLDKPEFVFPARLAVLVIVLFDDELVEVGVVLVELVFPVFPLKDLMYATKATSCSSVTCPLKVGIIGW
jgi:hypothetical protein